MFHRDEEVLVDFLLLFAGLEFEHRALRNRVVLLGIRGSDFLPVDAELENVDDAWVFFVDFRKRAKFLHDVRDEGRLDQIRLDELAVNFVRNFIIFPVFARIRHHEVFVFEIFAASLGFRLGLGANFVRHAAAFGDFFRLGKFKPVGATGAFPHEVFVIGNAPFAAEFNDLPVVARDRRRADNGFAKVLNEFADERHHAFVIGIRLIDFHHRKFRIVAAVDTFVAEDATDFENAFDPADEAAFQVKFERDTQEKFTVERVKMRDKRTRRSPAGNRVQ